jgi:anti-sigma factor RsiW
MIRELTQFETEQLNAFLDGELDAAEASRVEAMIASDAAWVQAAGELQSLDGLLGEYTVPAAPVELAGRIIAAARREQPAPQWTIRLAKYLAPVAAVAAALILYVAFYHPVTTNPPATNNQVANNNNKSQQDLDAVIVEHLPFFKQYEAADKVSHTDAVVDDATLKALDQLEHSQGT